VNVVGGTGQAEVWKYSKVPRKLVGHVLQLKGVKVKGYDQQEHATPGQGIDYGDTSESRGRIGKASCHKVTQGNSSKSKY